MTDHITNAYTMGLMTRMSRVMVKPDTHLSRKIAYKGKRLTVFRDKVKLGNGRKTIREVVDGGKGAAMVAFNKERTHVTLIKQYRHAINDVIYELPAGQVENGEAPYLTATRELKEETGFIANARSIAYIGSCYTSPGFVNEIIYTYKCTVKSKTLKQILDDEESIEVEWVPIEAIKDLTLMDAKTIVGLQLAGIL